MPNFFAKRDPWGNGLALWVLAAMLFFAPLMGAAITQLKTDNNVQNWLPADDPQAKVLAWYQGHFPAEDRILVTWDGSTLSDPRVDRVRTALVGEVDEDGVRRGGSPYVAEVMTARDVCTRIVELGVDPEEVLERLRGTLIGTGLIKVQLTPAGRAKQSQTIEAIKLAARTQMGIELDVQDPIVNYVDDALIADWEASADEFAEEGATDDELALLDTDVAPHDFRVTWAKFHPGSEQVDEFCELVKGIRGFATAAEPDGLQLIDDCFLAPGDPVGMIVTLSEAGSSDSESVLKDVRAAASAAGVPLDLLHMGGSSVTTAELNKAMAKCSWNVNADSWMPHKQSVLVTSFVVGVILAFYFLKSFRLGVLVLGISMYTTMISVTFIPLTGGSMNMVLMVMPALLNVLALSGAIHVANYWRHAALEDPKTAVEKAVETAKQPCVLASVTTALGLLSLMSSDLAPVRNFGLYSAIGCVIALVMVLYGLPAMLQLWPTSRPSSRDTQSKKWERFGGFITTHSTAITTFCILGFIAATAGLMHFQTETKVIRYFPQSARLVKDTQAIEQSLAGVASVETIVKFDINAQKEMPFLERLEIVRQVEEQIAAHPEISGTLSLADFQPVKHAPSDDASTFLKIGYNRRSSEVERRIKEDGEAGSAAFLAVADKSADLNATGDAELNAEGDELWRITAQSAVASDSDYGVLTEDVDQAVTSVLRLHPGASHLVTGTIPLFLRTQQAVLESLVLSFALAFGLIAAVMMILLRNPLAGLIAMLPNLLPVGTVFGLISWCGQHVDVGSMVTASVALGIAVDGTLHLLSWFRKGIAKGLSRSEAVKQALGHCGPAMWQTSAAVGLGLMMLAPAELLLVSRFGWLMASLICAALFADVIFLPALLMGPLGRLIERSMPKSISEDVSSSSADAEETARTIPCPPRPHFDVAANHAWQQPKTS